MVSLLLILRNKFLNFLSKEGKSRLIVIALTVAMGMTAYEGLKELIFHELSLWESHTITIIFSTFVASVASYFALRKYQKIEEALKIANNELQEKYQQSNIELQETSEQLIDEISERKQTAIALIKSENKYRSLTNQLPVGVYRTSPEGMILFANPALAKIFGHENVEDLHNMNVLDTYVFPEDRNKSLEGRKYSPSFSTSEVQLYHKTGRTIWVRDICRAIFNSDNVLLYYDGIIEDIS
ncbi:MAG: hypothetical protein QG635_2097, partial [Bacteroidota bacterium]|nr:hypothetical protein [Bacteroidota bacterium]